MGRYKEGREKRGEKRGGRREGEMRWDGGAETIPLSIQKRDIIRMRGSERVMSGLEGGMIVVVVSRCEQWEVDDPHEVELISIIKRECEQRRYARRRNQMMV